MNLPALKAIEKEQRINLNLSSSSALTRKHALLKLDKMHRNFYQSNFKKEKSSFYEIVGFNGDQSVLEAVGCSNVLVNEDNHGWIEGLITPNSIYDLHRGWSLLVMQIFSNSK